MDSRKDTVVVEMMVNGEQSRMFIARHDQGDAYACIDACVDKLERQLTDYNKKVRNRKHPQSGPVPMSPDGANQVEQ
ncbi:MAG: HPF/RaiA family ribosome-associated protein [Phycisphaerales bacterium]|nr:HPF/RaiA family ribosome-associated protein [Phycisphaerales bacterium]